MYSTQTSLRDCYCLIEHSMNFLQSISCQIHLVCVSWCSFETMFTLYICSWLFFLNCINIQGYVPILRRARTIIAKEILNLAVNYFLREGAESGNYLSTDADSSRSVSSRPLMPVLRRACSGGTDEPLTGTQRSEYLESSV